MRDPNTQVFLWFSAVGFQFIISSTCALASSALIVVLIVEVDELVLVEESVDAVVVDDAEEDVVGGFGVRDFGIGESGIGDLGVEVGGLGEGVGGSSSEVAGLGSGDGLSGSEIRGLDGELGGSNGATGDEVVEIVDAVKDEASPIEYVLLLPSLPPLPLLSASFGLGFNSSVSFPLLTSSLTCNSLAAPNSSTLLYFSSD